MLKSEVVIVSINRRYEDVLAFCFDPMNFNRWATEPDSVMEPLGDNEYLVDLPQGRRVLKYAHYNPHGILDYKVYDVGQNDGPTRPVRLVRNEEGTDLQVTWFQADGVTDEVFRSQIEWLTSDLARLKTLLEGG